MRATDDVSAPSTRGAGALAVDRFCAGTLAAGLLLRLGVIGFLRTTGLGEGLFRQLDAQAYDQIAWGLAGSWRGEHPFDVLAVTEHIQVGYYYFVAVLYLLFGRAPLAAQIANAVLGVAAAWLVYRVALRFADIRGARLALCLATFFPSLLFWSTQNLKDPLVAFLFVALVLAVLRAGEDGSPLWLTAAFLAGLALSTLRTYLFFLAGLCLAASLLWDAGGVRRASARTAGLVVGVLACLVAAYVFYRSLGPMTWNYLASPSLENLQRIRSATAGGGSSFLGHANVSSLPRLLALAPLGFAFALLAPWPWPLAGGSLLYRLATPEMLVWYPVLGLAVAGAVGLLRERRRGALLVVLLAAALPATLGIFQSNMGTLLRQRAPAALLIFVLAGAGLSAVLRGRARARHVLKRGLDLLLAGSALVVAAPLFLGIALAIRLTTGAPVFFAHERLGKGGRPFRLVKFRTMRPGPDPAGHEYSLADDPRITAVGRFLRRYSLDELPQLFNILRGDMSLVGPRPMRPELYAQWSPLVDKRLQVPPGLTGWQQVNGRNSLTWEQIVTLDAWYVDHASLGLDCKILWRTVRVVLSGEGLYFQREAASAPDARPGDQG